MLMDRREWLLQAVYGTGMVALTALATGIPPGLLLNPRRALAQTTRTALKPQFLLMSTSGAGDPLNCNIPGTYDDPAIIHSDDPSMRATAITMNGTAVKGAQVWSTLSSATLSRTCFFHHATYTIIHTSEPDTLKLAGSVKNGEMLISLLTTQLAPKLNTLRAQPISLANDPNEALTVVGVPQALYSPMNLAKVLMAPGNGLGTSAMLALRDASLAKLNAWAKTQGRPYQQAFVDQYALSHTQVRQVAERLATLMGSITDNGTDAQITAALALFQLNVTPAVAIHIPFGGDNHSDDNLMGAEVPQHISGVASIAKMQQTLASAGLSDKVTFAMTNVFGRTLTNKTGARNGRDHLDTHAASLMIGPNIKGGVVGGLSQPAGASDFMAKSIDSATGQGVTAGDIPYAETLGAMGKTLATAVGVDPTVIDTQISLGKAVTGVLTG